MIDIPGNMDGMGCYNFVIPFLTVCSMLQPFNIHSTTRANDPNDKQKSRGDIGPGRTMSPLESCCVLHEFVSSSNN